MQSAVYPDAAIVSSTGLQTTDRDTWVVDIDDFGSARTGRELLSPVGKAFEALFWIAMLIVFPLMVAPSPMSSSFSQLEQEVLIPKAAVLAIAIAVGVIAIAAIHQLSFVGLLRLLWRVPVPIRITYVLALATVIAEALLSREFAITILGTPYRLDGALIQGAWLLLPVIGFVLARGSRLPHFTIPVLFSIGVLLVGLWAALQTIHVEPLNAFGLGIVTRGVPVASLGHRALVSCLIGMGLMVPVGWLVLRGSRAAWLALPIAVLSAFLIASEGRAGVVGVGAALALLTVVTIYRVPSNLKYVGLALIAISVGVTITILAKDEGAMPLETLAAASQGNDGSFRARYAYYWPIAVDSIREKPLFGWGIEGFSRAFWSNSTPEQQEWIVRSHISRLSYPEVHLTGTPIQLVKRSKYAPVELRFFTVDRAHNWYLDTAIAFGIPYLLLLLFALVAWAWAVFTSNSIVAVSLGLAATVYLVFSVAWFATLQITPMFWLLFGASLGATLRRPSTVGDRFVA